MHKVLTQKSNLLPLAALALPGIALALLGLTHPSVLNAQAALYWRNLHITLLFLFPLLAVGPYLLLAGMVKWLRLMMLLMLYGFVFLYTALDLLNGVGAGELYLKTQPAMTMDQHGMVMTDYSPSITAILHIW
jgi:hypothetical protein